MNKTILIETISQRTGLTAEEVEQAVMTAFDIITERMISGQSVSVHGFGTFSVKVVPAKRSRDSEGELVWKPARKVPNFRPGETLSSRFEG